MKQLDLFSETNMKRRTRPVFKGSPLHPDLRRAHFFEVAPTMPAKRAAVLEALKQHGPVTCKELAARIGWEVTSVRPRMTELVRDGKARTTGVRRDGEYEFEAV